MKNEIIKKAGIWDPYLDTVGGGERYAMTLVEALLKKGWQVDIFWQDKGLKDKLKAKFNLGIDRADYLPYIPNQKNILERVKTERHYDLLFYFSDGSIPLMFGKKNLLHFQVPFKNILNPSLKNILKLKTINLIVCNSLFTKRVIDERLRVNSIVVYPPVDVLPIKPLEKEKIILSVGRFSQLMQSKRQDILVKVFKKMVNEKKISGWRLILAGGSEVGGNQFVSNLKKDSEGFPIEIKENVDFKELIDLYGKAKIFWSASGYQVDEDSNPEKVEHFGITTVEAMAAGCVPITVGKGGQNEIIINGKNGFLWQEEEQLSEITAQLVKDPKKLMIVSKNAIIRSKDFSKETFYGKIYQEIR